MLGYLYDIAVALEKIEALESFKTGEVVVETANVVNKGLILSTLSLITIEICRS